jgi:hypothetical protein
MNRKMERLNENAKKVLAIKNLIDKNMLMKIETHGADLFPFPFITFRAPSQSVS